VTPAEVARRVEAAGAMLAAELGDMPDSLSGWHPAEGEWCVKEVLAHLLITERDGFAGRIREMLAADEPRLAATRAADPACELALSDLLSQLARQRRASVELIAGLRPEDLDRAGIHERVGRLTVNDILHEWVHHDRAHLAQILGNVQAYVWPDMGGAQAFVR